MLEYIQILTPLFVGVVAFLGTLVQQHYSSEKRLAEERDKNKQLIELEVERHDTQVRLLEESLSERERMHRAELDKLIQGTNSMIRNDILEICRTALKNNYIDIYSLETLSGLYANYKAFGGNSIVEDLYMKTKALPVIDERDLMD